MDRSAALIVAIVLCWGHGTTSLHPTHNDTTSIISARASGHSPMASYHQRRRGISASVYTTADNNNNNSSNAADMLSSDRNSEVTNATSDAESLQSRLQMSTEFFIVPSSSSTTSTTPASVIITKTGGVCPGCVAPAPGVPAGGGNKDNAATTKVAPLLPLRHVFRNELWVAPVLTLSGVCMLLIAGFELFVICKTWRATPSRRHLFLGQMLLLGLFACACVGGALALVPTPLTCGIVRFGTGLAYSVVFASLLVKCVFLISLNGGVYLPAAYQGLLLLFAVLIQVAIGTQWLLSSAPLVDTVEMPTGSGAVPITNTRHRLLVTVNDIQDSVTATSAGTVTITLCRTPYMHVLYSLCYVLFLIAFVAMLAVKSRGIRDNYREATYIGLSVGCTIPIWFVWTLGGLVVNERHRDACLALGLIITAGVVFLVMFTPKGRQLAAMGKDGVYMKDREDRFSSLSRAGSGYSPSFFHFKPVKYDSGKQQPAPATITTLGTGGVFIRPDEGNFYTSLEPTLSSNPNVYFHRGNSMHPGMMY